MVIESAEKLDLCFNRLAQKQFTVECVRARGIKVGTGSWRSGIIGRVIEDQSVGRFLGYRRLGTLERCLGVSEL